MAIEEMEEIEDASIVEEVKERQPITARSMLYLVLCIVLAINSLLQTIAIFTPGWNTLISESGASYESVYYRTVCVTQSGTTTCDSKTFRALFSDHYDSYSKEGRPDLVLENSLRVRYQMNAQLSWIIIVATTVYQAFLYIRSTKLFPRLTALNAMILLVGCCFMYQVLYEAFSQIDYTRRSSEFIDGDVGFPYSLFFYSIAFVQTCASTFFVAKQTLDYICSLLHTSAEIKDKYESLKKHYHAKVEESRHLRLSQSDNTHLQSYGIGSIEGDIRFHGNQSPRHSPRPSPEQSLVPSPESPSQQSENRAHSLLERSCHAPDEHFDTPLDISAIHLDQK